MGKKNSLKRAISFFLSTLMAVSVLAGDFTSVRAFAEDVSNNEVVAETEATKEVIDDTEENVIVEAPVVSEEEAEEFGEEELPEEEIMALMENMGVSLMGYWYDPEAQDIVFEYTKPNQVNDSLAASKKNVVKYTIDLVDEKGETVTNIMGILDRNKDKIGTFTKSSNLPITSDTFSNIQIPGFTYEGGYSFFYWQGNLKGEKRTVTALKNMGKKGDNGNASYESYIGFSTKEDTKGADFKNEPGFFAYNPTGTLRIVFREATVTNPYKVIYYSMGKEVVTYETFDTPKQYEGNAPLMDGYTFLGWTTSADAEGNGTGDVVTANSPIWNTKVETDIRFYAKWQKNKTDISDIVIADRTITYGDTTVELTSDKPGIPLKVVDKQGNKVTDVSTLDAGTYDIVVDTDELNVDDYIFDSSKKGTLTVNKKNIEIAVSVANITYGETPSVGYTGGVAGLSVNYTTTPGVEKYTVGEYTVSGTCENKNYNVTVKSARFEVSRKAITVKADAKSINFGQLYSSVELSSSLKEGSSIVAGDDLVFSANWNTVAPFYSSINGVCTLPEGSHADSIVPSVTGTDAENYAVTLEKGALIVGSVENNAKYYVLKPGKNIDKAEPTDRTQYQGQSDTLFVQYASGKVRTSGSFRTLSESYGINKGYNGGEKETLVENAIKGEVKLTADFANAQKVFEFDDEKYTFDGNIDWYVIKNTRDNGQDWHIDGVADWTLVAPTYAPNAVKVTYTGSSLNETVEAAVKADMKSYFGNKIGDSSVAFNDVQIINVTSNGYEVTATATYTAASGYSATVTVTYPVMVEKADFSIVVKDATVNQNGSSVTEVNARNFESTVSDNYVGEVNVTAKIASGTKHVYAGQLVPGVYEDALTVTEVTYDSTNYNAPSITNGTLTIKRLDGPVKAYFYVVRPEAAKAFAETEDKAGKTIDQFTSAYEKLLNDGWQQTYEFTYSESLGDSQHETFAYTGVAPKEKENVIEALFSEAALAKAANGKVVYDEVVDGQKTGNKITLTDFDWYTLNGAGPVFHVNGYAKNGVVTLADANKLEGTSFELTYDARNLRSDVMALVDQYVSEHPGFSVDETSFDMPESIKTAGKYTVTADVIYTDATGVAKSAPETLTFTVEVNKAKAEMEAHFPSKVYDGEKLTKNNKATITSNGALNGTKLHFFGESSDYIVGTHVIVYTENYAYTAERLNISEEDVKEIFANTEVKIVSGPKKRETNSTATITAALLAITAPDQTYTYNGLAQGEAVKVTGLVGNDTASVLYTYTVEGEEVITETAPTLTTYGSIEVKVTAEAGNNYKPAEATYTLKVEKAKVYFGEVIRTKTYDGTTEMKDSTNGIYHTTVKFTDNKSVKLYFTGAPVGENAANVGEYEVEFTPYIERTLKFAAADGEAKVREYFDNIVIYETHAGRDEFSEKTPAVKVFEGGETFVGHYSKLTIKAADALSIEAPNQTYTYNGSAQGAAAKVVNALALEDKIDVLYNVNGEKDEKDELVWTSEVPTLTNVGTITVTVKAENDNYVTKEETYTLTINAPYVAPSTPSTPATPATPATPVAPPVAPVTPVPAVVTPVAPTPVVAQAPVVEIEEVEAPLAAEIEEVAEVEIEDEAAPLAAEVEIEDEDTPLAAGNCFIHWIILLITLVYAVYAVVRAVSNKREMEDSETVSEN